MSYSDEVTRMRVNDRLEVYRRRFEEGNTFSLLHAVNVCAEHGLLLPGWLATAYGSALQSFLQPGGPTSLDEIFHTPNLNTGTPAKAEAARKAWALGLELWLEAWDVARADITVTSLESALKSAIERRRFPLTVGKARTLFTLVEKNQLELMGHRESQALSYFLKKRKKQ